MLRHTVRRRAPVYCQICDNSRVDVHRGLVRNGVGFTIKIELGFAVTEMEAKQFQVLVDEHFKKVSPSYHTVVMGQVFDQSYNKVMKVVAGRRYIIGGSMKNGYIKSEFKFNGHRLNGMNGQYKGGLQWSGAKW